MTFGVNSVLEAFSSTFSRPQNRWVRFEMKEKRKQILGNWRSTKQQNPSSGRAAAFGELRKLQFTQTGEKQSFPPRKPPLLSSAPQSGNQLQPSLKPNQCQSSQPGWGLGSPGVLTELHNHKGTLQICVYLFCSGLGSVPKQFCCLDCSGVQIQSCIAALAERSWGAREKLHCISAQRS